jgi:hypothetical protein
MSTFTELSKAKEHARLLFSIHGDKKYHVVKFTDHFMVLTESMMHKTDYNKSVYSL